MNARRLVLAAAFFAVACQARTAPTSDVIVVGLANAPTNLDPGVGLDEASQKLHQLLFRSLVKIDAQLKVVPDLATSFETSDYINYVATIPAGVKFHDGREMTAEDVAFTFRRFLDPAFTSARKGAYSALRAIDVVDRLTVAFRLKAASASFPINLIMGIVPKGTGPEAMRSPIGSGPFRLKEFVPDDHVTLAPFAEAYGGAPANAGLVFKVVPDETMRGLELRNGSVDIVVNDLSPDLVYGLKREPRLAVVTGPGTDYAYIGMNLRDPLLADARVRRAIAFAVDTDAIINHLRRGLARPATGVVPSMSWAYAEDAPAFGHDLGRARRLLDEAGYRDPDGDGPQPRLRLTLKTSTAEAYRLQAAVLQQNLAEAGIALDVRSYEFATLMTDVVRGNVQLYTLQYVGVTDPDMLRRAFLSTQAPPVGFNRGHYKNAEVDDLITRASIALDETDRRDLYQRVQRLVAADAPYVSLWAKTNVAVSQRNLEGVALSPIADFTFLSRVHRVR
ncbi:MAG TPA: ABC transporter substrate-binding protein [Vicinamibacterales bacterium]|nr:ABC transporter substrate-binding protein [Vicinamibacterales bacterium]